MCANWVNKIPELRGNRAIIEGTESKEHIYYEKVEETPDLNSSDWDENGTKAERKRDESGTKAERKRSRNGTKTGRKRDNRIRFTPNKKVQKILESQHELSITEYTNRAIEHFAKNV
jgi:hypothetical protein